MPPTDLLVVKNNINSNNKNLVCAALNNSNNVPATTTTLLDKNQIITANLPHLLKLDPDSNNIDSAATTNPHSNFLFYTLHDTLPQPATPAAQAISVSNNSTAATTTTTANMTAADCIPIINGAAASKYNHQRNAAKRLWRMYLYRVAAAPSRSQLCTVLVLLALLINFVIFGYMYAHNHSDTRSKMASQTYQSLSAPATTVQPDSTLSEDTEQQPVDTTQAAAPSTRHHNNYNDDEIDKLVPTPKNFDDFETLLYSLDIDNDVPVTTVMSALKSIVKPGGDAERSILEGFMSGIKCLRALQLGGDKKCAKPDFFQQIHDALVASSSSTNNNEPQQTSTASNNDNKIVAVSAGGGGIEDNSAFEQFKSVWLTDMGPMIVKQFSGMQMTPSKVHALLAGLDANMLEQYIVPFLPTDTATLTRMLTTLQTLAGIPSSALDDDPEVQLYLLDLVQHVIRRLKQGYAPLFKMIVQEKLELWMLQGECHKINRTASWLMSSAMPQRGAGIQLWNMAKGIGLQPLLTSFEEAADDDAATRQQLMTKFKANLTRQYSSEMIQTRWTSSGGWDACLWKPVITAANHLFLNNDHDQLVSPIAAYIRGEFTTNDDASDKKYPRAPRNYAYLTQPNHEKYCSSLDATTSEKPRMLIVVLTSANNREWRDAIRKTFGSRYPDSITNIVFAINNNNINETDSVVNNDEKQAEDDMLQISSSSSKGSINAVLAAFEWWSQKCQASSYQYVMKVDENTFFDPINVQKALLHAISSSSSLSPQILGQVHTFSVPVRVPFSAAYLAHDLYDRQQLPSYVDRSAYILHSSIIPKLLKASKHVPLLPDALEAEFVTGILPIAAGLVESSNKVLTHSFEFSSPTMLHYRPDWCKIANTKTAVVRYVLEEELLTLWKQKHENDGMSNFCRDE